MEFENILYEVQDNIITITLNRPETLNAFTGGILMDLMKAFDHADADDGISAITITGAGRGFCAGQDLSAGEATWEGHEERLKVTGVCSLGGWSRLRVRAGGGFGR